jgi:hypothetical protein
MKLSMNIAGTSPLKIFKNNLSYSVAAVLAIVLVLTGLVVYRELGKISLVQVDQQRVLERMVRVNLSQEQALEKQLEENSRFEPVSIPDSNVFGTSPAGQ